MQSVRLPDDLAAWVAEYAAERGVSKSVLLESAVRAFREDCEAGVPELRAAVRRQQELARPAGPRPSREEFGVATADRSALFARLRQPASVKGLSTGETRGAA